MRIMALDVGTKNIGVALSDESATIAQGKEVVKRVSNEKALVRIGEIAGEFKVGKIVVGLPIHMDGTQGERAKDSVKFSEALKERTGLEIVLWDERLSTREVENMMIEASVSRKKRKKVVDKLAAQLILQGYLDSLSV